MFEAPILTLVGLAKFELPGHTLRLCDGGQVVWDAETFAGDDPDFGSIADVAALNEESGDEAPGGRLTFLPADTAAATLSTPSYQGSRMRFWLARVDEATGEVSGTPELIGDMQLDTTTLRLARGQRRLDMEYISTADRLFSISEGNVLSPTFHKKVWPGELGFDNATGVPLTVAWGVKGPPRGSVAGGGSGGAGGFVGAVQRLVSA